MMPAQRYVLTAALVPIVVLAFGPSFIPANTKNGSNPAATALLPDLKLVLSLASGNPEEEEPASATKTTTTIYNTGEKTVTLSKPLGLILEEVQEGVAAGVFVKEVSESGSAFVMADELQGMMIAKVMDTDCSSMDFDSVMDLIRNTQSNKVTLSFVPLVAVATDGYTMGTVVTIRVKQANNKDDLVFDAKVGDNLRQALIANGFEVYQGMKQKLGNCCGAGQCGFCAMTFIESDGWLDRSDYEDKKLSKFPGARLSCLNNIQGPATLQKTQR